MAPRPVLHAIAIAATLALVTPGLHAAKPSQPAPAVEASMVAKQAIDYYQNGQFALAAELYRRAYRIDPTKPEYLFGVGRSEQKAGHIKQSRMAFETLLGLLPSTDPFFKKCQQALNDLDGASPPPPAAAEKLPEKPPVVQTPTPPPTVVRVEPAPVVVVQPPTPVQPKTTPSETLQKPGDLEKSAGTDGKTVGWVLTASGGALALAGLGLALSTLSDASAWQRDSTTIGTGGRITGTDYQTASSTVSSLNTRIGVGIGMGAGGLACAGVGVWMLLHAPDKVSVIPTGNGVLLTGRF